MNFDQLSRKNEYEFIVFQSNISRRLSVSACLVLQNSSFIEGVYLSGAYTCSVIYFSVILLLYRMVMKLYLHFLWAYDVSLWKIWHSWLHIYLVYLIKMIRGITEYIYGVIREFGLQSSATTDDTDNCAVCLERPCTVAAEGILILFVIIIFF